MDSGRLDDEKGWGSPEALLSPAGWRVLVPGLPQWSWGRHDQALVFFGFHAIATLLGVFFWGTWLSLLMLAFAFASHAFSAADAIREAAFPKFGPMVPILAAWLGLGAACYAPVMILGSMFAWPVVPDHSPREGYWVNRWAYRGAFGPKHGETIWLGAIRGARPRLARVLAGEGQRVRWSENQLHVDDRPTAWSTRLSHTLELTVPDHHVLVSFHEDPTEPVGGLTGWEIVARDEIHGRAWARSYPVWERRLLR